MTNESLNPSERAVLKLLIEMAGGINRPIRFRDLRDKQFPEKVEAIYGVRVDYLDSLANRKLQKLRDKGWIQMADAVNIVVHDLPSN